MSTKWSKMKRRVVRSGTMTGLEVAIAAIFVFFATSLSLVLDDVLPHAPTGEKFSESRSIFLCCVVLSMGVLVLARWTMRRALGTLFHVQLLARGMKDQRSLSLERAKKQQLVTKSVIGKPDLEECTVNGVIDVHEDCEKAGSRLAMLINVKQDPGRCVVAPNMLWPMALGVGGHLTLWDDLRLLELSPDPERPDPEFSLKPRTETGVELEPVCSDEGPDGSPVGVILEFTAQAKAFNRRLLDQHGVTRLYRIIPERECDRDAEIYTGDQISRFAAGTAEKLKHLKITNGERDLVVVAMITKTQALAVGWHLAQMNIAFLRRTHLMQYEPARAGEGREERLIPMRVCPSQPTRPPWPLGSVEVEELRGGTERASTVGRD